MFGLLGGFYIGNSYSLGLSFYLVFCRGIILSINLVLYLEMYCIDISNVFRNVIISLGINIRIVNVLYLSNDIYMYVKYIYNENILKFLYKYFNYNIYI